MSNFYIGVVEDRHDPLQMGRVRVRVLGLHSDNRIDEVPIDSLPWSMVMLPANVSSTSGGISQLVEGTWVMVMYYDEYLQDPIVIGALPSTVGSQTPDYSKGFSDPYGVYPKWSDGTSNTTLIGKSEEYAEHPVYTERERSRVPSVPIAKRYKVSTVAEDAVENAYERSEWKESELRNNQPSTYPYNSVNEYEGGIVEEFDSTPGNQRVTRTHPSGSYDEIVVDGSRTIKIVGDGYEIILGAKNMYVKGNVNMTVDGSMNHFVKEDYTLEVGGNFYQMVGGSVERKVVGNEVAEIGQDVSINIGAEYYVRCGNTHSLLVGDDKIEIVTGSSQREIGADYSSVVGGSETRSTKNDYGRICLANVMEITKGNHNIETRGAVTIDTDTNLNLTIGANFLTEVALNAITDVGTNSIETVKGQKTIDTEAQLTLMGLSMATSIQNDSIINVGANMSESISGSRIINAAGVVDIDGSLIDLN